MRCVFGSHLYGTSTENSDTDYKSIYLPSKKSILLGKIRNNYSDNTKKDFGNTKNTKDDVDSSFYSLHYFIQLALEGQTTALDMLHASDSMLLVTSPIWEAIVANREKFYTKNIKSFVDYARGQAAKYGIRGSRLSDVKNVLNFLLSCDPDVRLFSVWDGLPKGEHIFIEEKNGIKLYKVCDRSLQETVKVSYAADILKKIENEYGERARQAKDNKNIDWKAVSHAVRAAFQIKQLFTEWTITFPLKEASLIRDIKLGKLDYLTVVVPLLEGLMEEVEQLALISTLPEVPNTEFWENFLITTLEKELFKC